MSHTTMISHLKSVVRQAVKLDGVVQALGLYGRVSVVSQRNRSVVVAPDDAGQTLNPLEQPQITVTPPDPPAYNCRGPAVQL